MVTAMTENGDRLSRIEAILEALAQRSVEADQRLTRIEQAQEWNQQQFSEANDRLTRIEQAIDETRKIADSNARAIQAWSLTIETDRIDREEADSELRVDINAVQQTLSQTAELQQTLLNVQLQDRDEWRQQREQINATVQESQHQIQVLIDSQNSDRQEWQQRSAHLDQQIQSLIDLSRENIQAHAAFRSDIQRIWDRVAG